MLLVSGAGFFKLICFKKCVAQVEPRRVDISVQLQLLRAQRVLRVRELNVGSLNSVFALEAVKDGQGQPQVQAIRLSLKTKWKIILLVANRRFGSRRE